MWLSLVALPAAAGEGEADGLDEILSRGTIRIAVYEDFAPYSYSDAQNQYAGIDVDLAAELARRLGVKLALHPFVADENMDDDLRNQVWKGHYLGGGVSDVMLHAGVDPAYAARQDKVELFNGYHHEVLAVAYRASKFGRIEAPIDLAGRKVAVEVDSIGDYYLSGAFNGRLRDAAVRKLSAGAAVDAYLSGETDAVMGPRGQLEGLLFERRAPREEALQVSEFAGMFRTAWDVGMAIRAGQPKLKAALSQSLEEMRADGTLEALFERHGVARVDPPLQAAAR